MGTGTGTAVAGIGDPSATDKCAVLGREYIGMSGMVCIDIIKIQSYNIKFQDDFLADI